MNLKRFGATLATLLMVAGFTFWTAGCGSSSSKARYVIADQSYGVSVDILVDNHVVASNLAYGASTGYMGISSGSRKIEVRPTGNASASSDIVSTTVTVQGSSNSTIVFDFANGGNAVTVFTDDNKPPASGQVKVRVIHAASFTGPVDVYAVTQGTGIGGVSANVSSLVFNTPTTPPISLNTGSYDIWITFAGSQTPVFSPPSTNLANLPSQAIRTVVIINAVNGANGFVVLTDR